MPAAQPSDLSPYSGVGWRLVEAQHVVSTMKLVDTLAEQALLEDILEATKPVIPIACRHLNYLLATPFRYGAPYPRGSRFRRAGMTEGVYYASEEIRTALAEIGYYRVRFFVESPDTPWPAEAAEFTGIAARLGTARMVDLTAGRFLRQPEVWTSRTDYAACQALADAARGLGAEMIRYTSVRDPARGLNLAVLSCAAFELSEPVARQSWRIRVGPERVRAIAEHPRQRQEFLWKWDETEAASVMLALA